MKGERAIATYRRLREQALWRLLAADNGPIILALLETHLIEGERSLPASILYERMGRSLEELRGQGHHLPQTAQSYVADWPRASWSGASRRARAKRNTNCHRPPRAPSASSPRSPNRAPPPPRAAWRW
jgi:hypothetical protein